MQQVVFKGKNTHLKRRVVYAISFTVACLLIATHPYYTDLTYYHWVDRYSMFANMIETWYIYFYELAVFSLVPVVLTITTLRNADPIIAANTIALHLEGLKIPWATVSAFRKTPEGILVDFKVPDLIPITYVARQEVDLRADDHHPVHDVQVIIDCHAIAADKDTVFQRLYDLWEQSKAE